MADKMKILVDFPDGYMLHLEVDTDADLDSDFTGKCLDTGETLTVQGYNASDITILPDDED